MRGKLCKELRGIAKGIAKAKSLPLLAYTGGEAKLIETLPSGITVRVKRGVPRRVSPQCERGIYKYLKSKV